MPSTASSSFRSLVDFSASLVAAAMATIVLGERGTKPGDPSPVWIRILFAPDVGGMLAVLGARWVSSEINAPI